MGVHAANVILRADARRISELTVLDAAVVGGDGGGRVVLADFDDLLVGVAQDAIRNHRIVCVCFTCDLNGMPASAL